MRVAGARACIDTWRRPFQAVAGTMGPENTYTVQGDLGMFYTTKPARHMGVEDDGTTQGEHGKNQPPVMFAENRECTPHHRHRAHAPPLGDAGVLPSVDTHGMAPSAAAAASRRPPPTLPTARAGVPRHHLCLARPRAAPPCVLIG